MDLFLPAAARREILREHGQTYGLNVFIETGTNDGDTPWALRQSFDQLFTVELDRNLWKAAVRRFASSSNVTCLHGDSAVILPQILRGIHQPALVWLDGHYSGPGTAHGDVSTPIRAELAALFNDGRPHVILIDDARIFEGEAEHDQYDHYAHYPSLDWIEQLATKYGYAFFLQDDIVRLTPGGVR